MTDGAARKYQMSIDPKILKLLGPNLYTNIYYVLAELIANAYDADASNVYIISKSDGIVVEDDGRGMSYSKGEVDKYLNVAAPTRNTVEDSVTPKYKRRRIGRKGVGKLAALSVSENILVRTKKDFEKSGFILSVKVNADHMLTPIPESEISFEVISDLKSGTSIVMQHPHYELNKTPGSIKRNLLKIFPLVNENFKIHILQEGAKPIIIDSFDKEMITQLGGLIVFGADFNYLAENFTGAFPVYRDKLLKLKGDASQDIEMLNNKGEKKSYPLIIKGWIGIYKTTTGRKSAIDDFPDNFVSIFSNKKLGEYNILPLIGKNRLPEVYVVGQFHVDLFEETELPDMALSNRQGYKTDDPRYQAFLRSAAAYLNEAVEMRVLYAKYNREEKEKNARLNQEAKERELREKVDAFKNNASEAAAKRIAGISGEDVSRFAGIIKSELNDVSPIIGIKKVVDAQKKKILISHSGADKDLADIIYKMLIFNRVPAEDIIYTSCDDDASRIPDDADIFNYLRKFFVDSYSIQKIYVIYVTSKDMAGNWFAVTEVGAGWIAKADHKVFNLSGHTPARPLDTGRAWQTSSRTSGTIQIAQVEADRFALKIEAICDKLGYPKKSRTENVSQLAIFADIV